MTVKGTKSRPGTGMDERSQQDAGELMKDMLLDRRRHGCKFASLGPFDLGNIRIYGSGGETPIHRFGSGFHHYK